MKLIYIAGPYLADTPIGIKRNILAAEEASLACWRAGWMGISPHRNTAGFEVYEGEQWTRGGAVWYEADLELLKRCDAIFMMRNWEESDGAKLEHLKAIEFGIPVYYETSGIPEP